MKGKAKCKALKEIRKKIAQENDIEYIVSECTHQGECKGTCPKCEAEVRYLERELAIREKVGKAVAVAGVATMVMTSLSACDSITAKSHGGKGTEVTSTKGKGNKNKTSNFWRKFVKGSDPDELDGDIIDGEIEEPLAGDVEYYPEDGDGCEPDPDDTEIIELAGDVTMPVEDYEEP